MADDIDAGWARERQVAEAREARERALADCGDVLEYLRERGAAGPVSQWTPPEPEPVRRQLEPSTPRPKPPPAPPVASKVLRTRHDSQGRVIEVEEFAASAAQAKSSWENWIRQHVAQQIEAFAMSFADGLADVENELGEKRRRRFEAIEARVDRLERAAGQGMREAADD